VLLLALPIEACAAISEEPLLADLPEVLLLALPVEACGTMSEEPLFTDLPVDVFGIIISSGDVLDVVLKLLLIFKLEISSERKLDDNSLSGPP